MKILLEAMRFSYQRINTVIRREGGLMLDEQDRCRLVEARDHLSDAVMFVLGPGEAQVFLERPDEYRSLLADPGHKRVGVPRPEEDGAR